MLGTATNVLPEEAGIPFAVEDNLLIVIDDNYLKLSQP